MGRKDRWNTIAYRSSIYSFISISITLLILVSIFIVTMGIQIRNNIKYFISDYMMELNIHDCEGVFILVNFDGLIIKSTNPDYEYGMYYPELGLKYG